MKVRKKLFLCAAAVLVFLLLLFWCGRGETAHAAAEQEGKEQIEIRIDELLAALDTEELQNYLDTLSQFEGISVKEKLREIVTGDLALQYDSLAQSVLALVWEEGRAMLPAFAVILAVALLCGILNSAKSGIMQGSLSDIIHFVGFLAVGASVLACLVGVLQAGFGTISAMKTQMQLVYPLLLSLMAASGGTVSVGIYRPAVAFMSSAVCELFTAIVLPTSVVVIVLAFVGSLSDDVRTERLGDLFKSINKWLIGFSLALFSLFITVQGITAAQYDGLTLRAAKYVISGSVPLVGGFLSGGAELVVAGSALIKNALGSFAVFLLFGTILRPAMLFCAFQLFLRGAAAVTEPVGGKISSFLSRLAGDSGFFFAGLMCVAFLYFLTLLLLICSTGAIL